MRKQNELRNSEKRVKGKPRQGIYSKKTEDYRAYDELSILTDARVSYLKFFAGVIENDYTAYPKFLSRLWIAWSVIGLMESHDLREKTNEKFKGLMNKLTKAMGKLRSPEMKLAGFKQLGSLKDELINLKELIEGKMQQYSLGLRFKHKITSKHKIGEALENV